MFKVWVRVGVRMKLLIGVRVTLAAVPLQPAETAHKSYILRVPCPFYP